MRKVLLLLFLVFCQTTWALDRQPNSDFRMRRQSLASKISSGAVLLFASNEAEGPNDLYGYRPDDNFFYLSGWSEPGAALLIMPATSKPAGNTPGQSIQTRLHRNSVSSEPQSIPGEVDRSEAGRGESGRRQDYWIRPRGSAR